MKIRRAVEGDLAEVVRLFATPDVGNAKNEIVSEPVHPAYISALASMADDPNNALMVADTDRVVGVFQFTVIQHIANTGAKIAQIENVVVHPDCRGRGIGEEMMRWAIDEAKRRGCFRVQLTTNKIRERAHRFYERLGFVATHEGMKLVL